MWLELLLRGCVCEVGKGFWWLLVVVGGRGGGKEAERFDVGFDD
jgi:hypothetical protein